MATIPTSPNGLNVPMIYVNESGFAALSGAYINTDSLGNNFTNLNTQLGSQAYSGGDNSFWDNVAVAAAGVSAAVSLFGTYGRAIITGRASAATNLTVQVSYDGANWYTLTQDAIGTQWALALTATQLSGARDLILNTSRYLRLVSSAAATITAGLIAFVS